jgi:hypothetical protein
VRGALSIGAVLALLAAGGAAPARADEAGCWRARVYRAEAFARGRAGAVTFVLVDTHGRRFGVRYRQPVRGVSLIKSLVLVAYLREPDVRARSLGAGERELLGAMIRVSDNAAAGTMIARVGRARLEAAARAIGMTSFRLIEPFWGLSPTTALDQAILFRRLDGIVPRRHLRFARSLFAGIVPSERWGMPRAAPPGFRILFKGGWGYGTGKATHQVGRFERGSTVIVVAVTTFGSPDTGYGAATIEGVTRALLGRAPCRRAAHRAASPERRRRRPRDRR